VEGSAPSPPFLKSGREGAALQKPALRPQGGVGARPRQGLVSIASLTFPGGSVNSCHAAKPRCGLRGRLPGSPEATCTADSPAPG